MKFYKCATCGKIIAVVKDTDVETVCCGQPMECLVTKTKDEGGEKHVPVYSVVGNTVTVKVGTVEHPMTESHHIEWIAIESDSGCQCRHLHAGSRPEATFALIPYEKVRNVYEYCNLHGLWKCCPACAPNGYC